MKIWVLILILGLAGGYCLAQSIDVGGKTVSIPATVASEHRVYTLPKQTGKNWHRQAPFKFNLGAGEYAVLTIRKADDSVKRQVRLPPANVGPWMNGTGEVKMRLVIR